MALYNSTGTSEVEKTVPTYEDLGAFYVDTDGYPHGYIFGYTSHLMRRKAQVVEGETLISLGVNPRKRLHSAPVEDVECGGRPNPEGAGSVSVTELSHYGEKGEGEGTLCQRCQIIATELNRQALALADPASLKVCNFERSALHH
ncbi:unnamed protein product [Coregonus sp. 'balchen']|uniref:Uncharacterized protein n=1 Tax=Coregonus suidteri TaxID=861788 RepID=A0AAN8KTC5_9TELE|nr:unnamed protein product [Coregonus sp. 'balchen']